MVSSGIDQSIADENNSATFDLLFRGEIATGEDIDQVKAKIATSFKLDEAAVQKLFSGAVVSLKRNIDRAAAERIYQRLTAAGALAKIVPHISNKSTSNQPDANDQTSDKAFSLAPLGSNVLENAGTAEQDQQQVPVDHLNLGPLGGNILEEAEAEIIEPIEVDTAHLTLE